MTRSILTDQNPDAVEANSAAIKDYYEGPAERFYREVWGQSIHVGLFEGGDDPSQALEIAQQRAKRSLAAAAGIGPDCRVLEVACGWGATSRFLASELGCEVVATNISERALERAAEHAARAGLSERIDHRVVDYHALPFDDACFDVYVCQDAFIYAADLSRVLAEARRVLRPRGRVVFSAYLMSDELSGSSRREALELIRSPSMRSSSDYLGMLRGVGFGELRFDDWSDQLAPTYTHLVGRLERLRERMLSSMSEAHYEELRARLGNWILSGRDRRIGYGLFDGRATVPAPVPGAGGDPSS